MSNFVAVREFAAMHSRFPVNSRRRSSEHELRLAAWLREQRRHQLRLNVREVTLLEELQNFEWSPHEDAWDRQLQRWINFLGANNREPMYTAVEKSESGTAAWAIRQRFKVSRVKLLRNRQRVLQSPFGLD